MTDFPQLQKTINGKRLIYLDSAASSLMPNRVEEIIHKHNTSLRSNVHRSANTLGEEATTAYEHARQQIADFIRAQKEEIIFTKNATEAFNILAYGLLEDLEEGDEIVLSMMEHHSNLVPWQQLAKKKGIQIQYITLTEEGLLDMNSARKLIGEKTRIVAVTQMSNVLACINPIKELADLAHEQGALIVVDGAQSIAHLAVDVQNLDCDFFVFSGHKLYGPTGIGVLYGRKEHLENMEPVVFGGDMIEEVSLTHSTWNDVPWKFEAGTPPIVQAIGLGEASCFMQEQLEKGLLKHEKNIMSYALSEFAKLKGVHILGSKDVNNHKGLISFTIDGVHHHDAVSLFDREGIQVRGGYHCAEPLFTQLHLPGGSIRLSIATHTTKQDIDAVIASIQKIQKLFGEGTKDV